MRRFLAYCPIDGSGLQRLAGTPDYSYHFVMAGYLPVLRTLGEVIRVQDLSEVDDLYRRAVAEGVDCRLLCFCPPHRAPVGLQCPTTVVLAWEFDTLRDVVWDNEPRNDWRTVLADHGNAITLSGHSADVVARAMGPDFPVSAVPVPAPADQHALVEGRKPPSGISDVEFRGRTIDTDALVVREGSTRMREPAAFVTESWGGERRGIGFDSGSVGRGYIVGFYKPEPWGVWSRESEPWVLLPFALSGRVEFSVTLFGYGRNVGRTIEFQVGGHSHPITLSAEPTRHDFTMTIKAPSNQLSFAGLDTRRDEGSTDMRTLALGLCSIDVRSGNRLRRVVSRAAKRPLVSQPIPDRIGRLSLSGVVYTTVLNPEDGRKNFLEIIKAFAYSMRDRSDATLVIKITHHSMAPYFADVMHDLAAIGPMRCRLVVLHAYLGDEQFAALRDATTYYVNASLGEGLCLPLLEFMAAGVPAVAPDHTAMGDYVSEDNTFVVGSSLQPAMFPGDPVERFRTTWRRIDWWSLVQQFEASYRVATTDPDRYRRMSEAAARSVGRHTAPATVGAALEKHLERL